MSSSAKKVAGATAIILKIFSVIFLGWKNLVPINVNETSVQPQLLYIIQKFKIDG